jgi:hypothetical protein
MEQCWESPNKDPKVSGVTFGATPLNKSFRAKNIPLHCAANDWAEAELQKAGFLSIPSFSCISPFCKQLCYFYFSKESFVTLSFYAYRVKRNLCIVLEATNFRLTTEN